MKAYKNDNLSNKTKLDNGRWVHKRVHFFLRATTEAGYMSKCLFFKELWENQKYQETVWEEKIYYLQVMELKRILGRVH